MKRCLATAFLLADLALVVLLVTAWAVAAHRSESR